MNAISFPNQYKKALLNKTKNSTIRIGEEIGKYKIGKTYSAKSYAGTDWGVKIKILEIVPTTVNKLSALGIPKQSIKALQKKTFPNKKVELIRFKVL